MALQVSASNGAGKKDQRGEEQGEIDRFCIMVFLRSTNNKGAEKNIIRYQRQHFEINKQLFFGARFKNHCCEMAGG